MFSTVMERLSSRWHQHRTAGMTHIQRYREAACTVLTQEPADWGMMAVFHLGVSS